MSWAWADNSNDVSHLRLEYELTMFYKALKKLKFTVVGVVESDYCVSLRLRER